MKIIKALGGNKNHDDDGHHPTHAVSNTGKIDLQIGEASVASTIQNASIV
jgi:hypothetical protein